MYENLRRSVNIGEEEGPRRGTFSSQIRFGGHGARERPLEAEVEEQEKPKTERRRRPDEKSADPLGFIGV